MEVCLRSTRRDVLRQGLTLAALSSPTAALARARKKGFPNVAPPTDPHAVPIVDTHQHLWDLDRFHLAWVSGAPSLNRSFLLKDYAEATAGLGVEKTIYMEVDLDPAQQVQEAEFVIETCQRDDNPMVAGVISGRPASPGFKEYITRYKGSPYIKGVRQVLHAATTPPGFCLQPEFVKSMQLLGELDMSFDLCLRAAELTDGAKLIDRCPHTRFILDHCGNANVQQPEARGDWERAISEVAQRKHVVCKVSGIVASAKPGAWKPEDLEPYVRHVIQSFGWDRVMFGGDWPVCTNAATYRQWVEALRWIVRDESLENRRKLFHDNAVKFYGVG
jgi:L-fuconolactonase